MQGPFHGSLVLIGSPGSGKSIYGKQFLGRAIQNGSSGVYAFTESSVAKVEEGLALLGFDVNELVKTERLQFLDLRPIIEERAGRGQIGIRGWLKGPNEKQPLTEVSQRIGESVANLKSPVLVVDTLTTFLLRRGEEELLGFLETLLDHLKTANVLSLFTLTPSGCSEKCMNVMRSLFDGVLELKVDESTGAMKRLLRIFSLKGTPHRSDWLSFSISNEGLTAEEPLQTRCALCSRPIRSEPIKYEASGQIVYFDNRECFTTYRKLKSVYGDTFL